MIRNDPKTILGYRKDGRPILPIAGGSEPVVEPEATIDPEAQEPLEPQAGEELNSGEEPSGGNPAWKEVLDALPTSLHSQVTPFLEKWDKGVQQRFETIHSEYEPYKAFKEKNVDPETINYALGIVNALQEDPRQVYESIAEYYKFGNDPAPVETPEPVITDPDDLGYVDPKIAELEKNQQLLAQYIMAEQQTKEQAVQDAKLAQELSELKTKHGDFDEAFVVTRMLNGDSPEDAVKAFQDIVENVKKGINKPPKAPSVIGAGGSGVATKGVNPATLTDAERKKLTVDLLAKAAAEG